jgi:hypothetical protein
LKSESLNLLEPSGPAQAYNGIALPLLYQGATTKIRIKCLLALYMDINISEECIAAIFKITV